MSSDREAEIVAEIEALLAEVAASVAQLNRILGGEQTADGAREDAQ